MDKVSEAQTPVRWEHDEPGGRQITRGERQAGAFPWSSFPHAILQVDGFSQPPVTSCVSRPRDGTGPRLTGRLHLTSCSACSWCQLGGINDLPRKLIEYCSRGCLGGCFPTRHRLRSTLSTGRTLLNQLDPAENQSEAWKVSPILLPFLSHN